MNLNAVRVFVRDINSAKSFYSEHLGLPMQHDGSEQGFCVFKPGATTLVVEVVAFDAPEDEQVLVGRFTGLSFQVANAQESFLELSSKGVEFTGEPERQAWGGVLATLRDPSGNQIQICQHPSEASQKTPSK